MQSIHKIKILIISKNFWSLDKERSKSTNSIASNIHMIRKRAPRSKVSSLCRRWRYVVGTGALPFVVLLSSYFTSEYEDGRVEIYRFGLYLKTLTYLRCHCPRVSHLVFPIQIKNILTISSFILMVFMGKIKEKFTLGYFEILNSFIVHF